MESTSEIVYTMTDYYDGPRTGIANFQGQPHIYQCLFDEIIDNYSDIYLLQPIDEETFKLALEDWAIWLRWEVAYAAGQSTIDTHPALPEDRVRSIELQKILKECLQVDMPTAIRAHGSFSSRDEQGNLWVRWVPSH